MGTNINCLGHRLRTPLHCAVAQGHLAVARHLLMAGAKVDAEDVDGHTPLSLAAAQGNRDLVDLLLQKGAQPNEGVVSTAAENGHWNVVELFLQKDRSFVDVCNKEGHPLIVLAAKANRWDVVQLLLKEGASATECKMDEESALVWASLAGQADVMRQLLCKGAKLNNQQVELALQEAKTASVVWAFVDVVPDEIRGKNGELGLLNAGWDGRLEAMVTFLEAGVNINAIDICGDTTLSDAAWKGHLECVKELLQRGADVNTKGNTSGDTALHRAAANGHAECVRALLDAGANREARNKNKKTPFEVAISDEVRQIFP